MWFRLIYGPRSLVHAHKSYPHSDKIFFEPGLQNFINAFRKHYLKIFPDYPMNVYFDNDNKLYFQSTAAIINKSFGINAPKYVWKHLVGKTKPEMNVFIFSWDPYIEKPGNNIDHTTQDVGTWSFVFTVWNESRPTTFKSKHAGLPVTIKYLPLVRKIPLSYMEIEGYPYRVEFDDKDFIDTFNSVARIANFPVSAEEVTLDPVEKNHALRFKITRNMTKDYTLKIDKVTAIPMNGGVTDMIASVPARRLVINDTTTMREYKFLSGNKANDTFRFYPRYWISDTYSADISSVLNLDAGKYWVAKIANSFVPNEMRGDIRNISWFSYIKGSSTVPGNKYERVDDFITYFNLNKSNYPATVRFNEKGYFELEFNSNITGNTWWGFRASTALFLKIFGKEVPSFDIIPKSSSVNSTVTTSVISYNTYTDFYIDAGINGIAKNTKVICKSKRGDLSLWFRWIYGASPTSFIGHKTFIDYADFFRVFNSNTTQPMNIQYKHRGFGFTLPRPLASGQHCGFRCSKLLAYQIFGGRRNIFQPIPSGASYTIITSWIHSDYTDFYVIGPINNKNAGATHRNIGYINPITAELSFRDSSNVTHIKSIENVYANEDGKDFTDSFNHTECPTKSIKTLDINLHSSNEPLRYKYRLEMPVMTVKFLGV